MSAERNERLKAALAEIHKRWGSDALRPLSAMSVSSTHIPTGFPALDALLGGGVSCGGAVELSGVPTSGMTTLALKVIAEAQGQGRPTVYVDLASIFDPGYAVRCGIQLNRLLIARPEDVSRGLDILYVVGAEADSGLVVFDSITEALAAPHGSTRLNSALRRLSPALRQSGCTAVLLRSGAQSHAAISHVALRLHVENAGWIEEERNVSGLQARVTVLKDSRNRSGQQVEFPMTLDDPARKDAA